MTSTFSTHSACRNWPSILETVFKPRGQHAQRRKIRVLLVDPIMHDVKRCFLALCFESSTWTVGQVEFWIWSVALQKSHTNQLFTRIEFPYW